MEELHYDARIAELYDAVVDSGYHSQKIYLDELRNIVPKGSSLLELGCGTGNITIPLSKQGINCEGVDSSAHMLYRLKEKNSNIITHLSDIRTFVLDKDYDYALSCSGPFSIKGEELESYILDPVEVHKSLVKYGKSAGNGILINKGKDKEPLEIPLRDGRVFRHRELRDGNYMLMHQLLYDGGELKDEITHVKRRYSIDFMFEGADVKDFENFMLIKFNS